MNNAPSSTDSPIQSDISNASGKSDATPAQQAQMRNIFNIVSNAEYIGNHHEIYTDGHADVEKLVKKLHGKIVKTHGKTVPEIEVFSKNRFVIRPLHLNSKQNNNFAIAHAIGHYMLHYRLRNAVGDMKFYRNRTGIPEIEANMFAYALLVPSILIKKALDENISKNDLIKELGITESMWQRRVKLPMTTIGE